MTGWEIRQALKVILAHDDQVIETGLTWLTPDELTRLAALATRTRRTDDHRQAQDRQQGPDRP